MRSLMPLGSGIRTFSLSAPCPPEHKNFMSPFGGRVARFRPMKRRCSSAHAFANSLGKRSRCFSSPKREFSSARKKISCQSAKSGLPLSIRPFGACPAIASVLARANISCASAQSRLRTLNFRRAFYSISLYKIKTPQD